MDKLFYHTLKNAKNFPRGGGYYCACICMSGQIGDDVRKSGTKIHGIGEQLRVIGSLEEQERRAFVFYDPSDCRRSIACWRQSFKYL